MRNKVEASKLSNFLKDFDLPEGAIIERKGFTNNVALQQNEERTFIAKLTVQNVDADGDLLLINGCNTIDYEKNPVVLWNHQHSNLPIGKVLAIQKTEDTIYAKIQLATTDFANDVWELVYNKFLQTLSVGFIPIKSVRRGTQEFLNVISRLGLKIAENCNRIVTEWKLIENSVVPLPANSSALILAVSTKSIKLGDKMIKDLQLKTIEEEKKIEENLTKPLPETEIKAEDPPEPVKVEPIWQVVREGGYKASEQDKQLSKALKMGKIV